MSVALPVCIKRTPFAREAVIKILQSSGRWSELQTADVVFDDHRVGHCLIYGMVYFWLWYAFAGKSICQISFYSCLMHTNELCVAYGPEQSEWYRERIEGYK